LNTRFLKKSRDFVRTRLKEKMRKPKFQVLREPLSFNENDNRQQKMKNPTEQERAEIIANFNTQNQPKPRAPSEPSLITHYGDERRKFPFQLCTDRVQCTRSAAFARRVSKAELHSIVDVCVKQRPDRNINKYVPDHQNSLYDIWLVVKVREGTGQKTLRTLTALAYINESEDTANAVREIVHAQKTFLLEKYRERAKKARTSFLRNDEENYESSCDLLFNIFFRSNESGDFAVITYDNNQDKHLRQEYWIVTTFASKVFKLSFIAIESLRRTLTLSFFHSLEITENDEEELPRELLRYLSEHPGCEQTLQNFRANWRYGRTFYIVSVGAGSCRDCLFVYRHIKQTFGKRLRLKAILLDTRFKPIQGAKNPYYYNLQTIQPSSISCNSLTNCYDEMLEEEKKQGEEIFQFYHLDYTHSNIHAFYKLRLRTLHFMGSPDCAPFSKSNYGATELDVRKGTIGVFYVLTLLFACRPAMWVLESSGAPNNRLLKNQPLMHHMERLRGEFTHCAYEKEFIREDDRYTLWVHKLTHVWSSHFLTLRCCKTNQRCLCYFLYGKHRPVENLPTKEEKAMWPLGFIMAMCDTLEQLLLKHEN